jgi:hypothetical protein
MKNLTRASVLIVTALFLISVGPVASFGQCFLNCPAGDGGIIGPGAGNKSPDMDGSGAVNLVDLAMFAAAWPPNPYDFCADFNCDGLISLPDLAIFAVHWGHVGPVPGFCQPGVDHYKRYLTQGPSIVGPFILDDQFGGIVVDVAVLTRFATPVSKNNQPLLNPQGHQTWWEFAFPQPIRFIIARDQFGEHDWMLGDARYLVLPALKNEPGEPPIQNHYLCYDAQGPPIDILVVLEDQFGVETVVVLHGFVFCNPVKKTLPDGTAFPIIDRDAHLTCYLVDNPNPHQIPVRVTDQFFADMPLTLFENDCLCLPALKREVIEPGSSQWQRIKALYE